MPLLQENISQNQQLLPSQSSRPCPVVLDWDNTELPIQVQDVNEGFDLILYVLFAVLRYNFNLKNDESYSMADVTYNTASFGSLVRTLKGIVEIGKTTRKGRPLYVLLGYKERDVEERVLWDMVYEIGLDFKHIGDVPGTGGPPVEVWISIQTFSTDCK